MDKEQSFWNWFVRHEDELMHFERDRESVFDALSMELARVHPDLTFEFGPEQNQHREFVISAGGIKAAFPAVESLVASAPDLPAWTVIAFRPRRTTINVIELGAYRIDPDDVQYSLLRCDNKLGVYLFLPGYADGDASIAEIAYLFLDEALGEYDVETKLGLIKMLPADIEVEGPRFPLRDLPAHFDEASASLMG